MSCRKTGLLAVLKVRPAMLLRHNADSKHNDPRWFGLQVLYDDSAGVVSGKRCWPDHGIVNPGLKMSATD
jgi:hypothetical protein